MEPIDFVIPIFGTIGGAIVLSMLAASLPESAAWVIARWFDLWAWRRTCQPEVRDGLADIEEDFWARYMSEQADGSGPVRATYRALGFVIWEVVRAPSIAGSVDRALATESSRRKSRIRILTDAIARLVGIRSPHGPVLLFLLGAPLVAHVIFMWSGVYRVSDQTTEAGVLEIVVRCLASAWCLLQIIGLVAKTQLSGFTIRGFVRSVPSILSKKPMAVLLLAGYYGLLSAFFTARFGVISLSDPAILAVFILSATAIGWSAIKILQKSWARRSKSGQ